MIKTRYSATFSLPDGSEFVLTRPRRDYGYTVAWLVVDHQPGQKDRIVSRGFSSDRRLAEGATRIGEQNDRIALYAPVTKGGAS